MELEEKQDILRSLQDTAELLSLENHPAKQTVEVSGQGESWGGSQPGMALGTHRAAALPRGALTGAQSWGCFVVAEAHQSHDRAVLIWGHSEKYKAVPKHARPGDEAPISLCRARAPSSSVGLQGMAAAPGGRPISHFVVVKQRAAGARCVRRVVCWQAGRQKANLRLQQPPACAGSCSAFSCSVSASKQSWLQPDLAHLCPSTGSSAVLPVTLLLGSAHRSLLFACFPGLQRCCADSVAVD